MPEVFAFIRAFRVYTMRKVHWPPYKFFGIVILFETLHTVGAALLFYVVLPDLDSPRAIMLTNGVLIFPCVLSIFRPRESGKTKVVNMALDSVALLIQVIGLVIWPVLNMNWGDDWEIGDFWNMQNSWALPLSLFLLSFGWWESFVDEHSKFFRGLWRVKINMIEENTRYTTYMVITLWKIVLFFGLFLLFSRFCGPITDIAYLFDYNLGESFRGTNGFFLEDGFNLDVSSYLLPLKVLAVQVGCGYGMYIFGKFACKVKIQKVSFALPSILVMPATLAGLLGMCYVKDKDPCSFDGSIPNHVFFQCPAKDDLMTWFGSLGSFMAILWFLSSVWISRHIWSPKSQKLASTEQMFGTPYYSGLLLDQQMVMNRRSDDGIQYFR